MPGIFCEESHENYAVTTSMLEVLEVARKMAPDDPFIAKLFAIVGNYEAGHVSANNGE